ncbi:MAG: UDP-3-O-(3-hydroxymyristoyl)glucosamine N-acyltransferase [Chitinivibrionales bacterium]|nr:UDP-3-O-(3-hydroxymyristoyl)glucosamine N-acyltransferase [Chitinivibrionales bacterium]
MKLSEIAEILQCSIPQESAGIEIDSITSPEYASDRSITFLSNPRFIDAVRDCKARAVITRKDQEVEGKISLVVDNPYVGYAKVAQLFETWLPADGTVHNTAIVGSDTTIADDVRIGPYAVIGDDCSIAAGTVIGAHVVVEHNVSIGENCRIHAGVKVTRDCWVGNRVIIECGAIIGSEGFANGRTKNGEWVRIPSFGNVVVDDDAWVGANTCIDRGSFGSTRIGKGARLDNLIHIAHNVRVDDHTAMAAQTGIAGSCNIGKRTILAGQVGVADHVNIGDDVFIGAKAGISKGVESGRKMTGCPARDIMKIRRIEAVQLSLPDMAKELKMLKREVQQLKETLSSDEE